MPMAHCRRAFLAVTIFCLALVAVGCHFSSIIFDRMDWLVMNQVDGYFDLSWQEEREVKPQVTEWVQWAKKVEMSPLLAMAKDLQASARAPWSKSQVMGFWDRLGQIRFDIVSHGAPVAASFLKARGDGQWRHLLETAREKDEKARALLALAASEYTEAYAKRVLKPRFSFYETWLGSLRDDQRAWLAAAWMESPSALRDRLELRQAMYASFVAEVKAASAADLEKKLMAWAQDPSLLVPADRRADYQRQKDAFVAALSHLSRTLDDKQRQHFLGTLTDLVSDLEAFRRKA